MKKWSFIPVAAAILVVAVPSAFSASRAIPADEASGTAPIVRSNTTERTVESGTKDVVKLNARIKSLVDRNKALAARNRALAAENLAQTVTIANLNQQVWTLTHPAGQVIPEATTDPDRDCIDYVLCTQEQGCRIWGNGCYVADPAQPVDAAPESQPATQD